MENKNRSTSSSSSLSFSFRSTLAQLSSETRYARIIEETYFLLTFFNHRKDRIKRFKKKKLRAYYVSCHGLRDTYYYEHVLRVFAQYILYLYIYIYFKVHKLFRTLARRETQIQINVLLVLCIRFIMMSIRTRQEKKSTHTHTHR
jgi:hypothetical protein